MAKRICRYPNCDTVPGSVEYTFFQFPKDPNRLKEWFEIMQLDEDLDSNKLYICERHINPIYIASNPRRKILLHNAVPYPYEGSDKKVAPNKISKEPIILNKGVRNTVEISLKEDSDVESIEEYKIESPVASPVKTPPAKKLKQDVPDSSESSNVSIFVFKNQEYIQMPKVEYENRIATYKDEIKRLRHTLNRLQTIIKCELAVNNVNTMG